jgi:Zn-dependent protease with chaperone function
MKRCVIAHRFFVSALVCFCFALSGRAGVASEFTADAASPLAQTPATTATPQAQSMPASEQAKTEQFTLSHERAEKAIAYSRAGYTLYFVSHLVMFVVLVLVLRLRVAAKLRDFAENISANKWIQGLVFVPLLVLLVDIFDLPVSIYWHGLSLQYQQSIQGWDSWMWDWAKSELLQIGFALVLALILYALMRRFPRRWWFYFWVATLPIVVFVVFITPVVIDPLFNKFEPLANQHPDLVKSIEKLTQRAGVPIPPERMFLMEASQKTNSINAYVTGIGGSKRVVIWDTTLTKTSQNEALFIIGHELGHYVLDHVWIAMLYFAIGLFAALYLMFRGLHWALDRWGKEWKIYGVEDWASLAVILLLFEILTFFSAPVVNGLSRAQEHAADVYGLEVIHGIVPNSEEVAAHAFQVIGDLDLSDPNPPPFITVWLYSHPPLAERLVFAHSYDPWAKGESPKYVKR